MTKWGPPGDGELPGNGGPARVHVEREGTVESRHLVHWVVRREGRTVASGGDPDRITFARSAAKPFQALPLVEDGVLDHFGLGGEELAVACASHNSEAGQVRVVRRFLQAVGVEEEALACGGHWPLLPDVARRFAAEGREPRAVESNCSGKHAGMLALARRHGWPLEDYHRPGHPVQDRMTAEVARWTGVAVDDLRLGVAGGGVVRQAVPLVGLADAYAAFGAAATRGDAPAAVVAAMTGHPFLVAGTGRLCTALMASVPGVVAKVGAEGVYGAAVPEAGLGIAVKVEDGHRRAADPVLVGLLLRLQVVPADLPPALAPFAEPDVLNTRGETVGRIRAEFPRGAA